MYFENEPTGFHLIMLLKSDVSCSSVHASDMMFSILKSTFVGIAVPSAAGLTASPGGIDAALEGWRTFFLGGMADGTIKCNGIFFQNRTYRILRYPSSNEKSEARAFVNNVLSKSWSPIIVASVPQTCPK